MKVTIQDDIARLAVKASDGKADLNELILHGILFKEALREKGAKDTKKRKATFSKWINWLLKEQESTRCEIP